MNRRTTTTLLTTCLSLSLLGACGVREGGELPGTGAATDGGTQSATDSSSTDGETTAAGLYDGDYLQGCSAIDRHNLAQQDAVITLNIQRNRVVETVYNYLSGTNCAMPAVPPTIEMVYTMRYTGGVSQTGFGTANDITLTPGVFSIADQEVSRSDRTFLQNTTDIYQTIHTLIVLNGSNLHLGVFSQGRSGRSDEDRFVVAGSAPFVRQ